MDEANQKFDGFVACQDCASQCLASHSNVNWCHGCTSSSRIRADANPSCLVTLTPPMLATHRDPHPFMVFPSSFALCNLSKCVGEVKLEGPSGWVWPCSLEKSGDSSVILTRPGWEDFSLDHDLKEGDALLFTFVGRNLFKVRIFQLGGDGAEKGRDCFPSSVKALGTTSPSDKGCKDCPIHAISSTYKQNYDTSNQLIEPSMLCSIPNTEDDIVNNGGNDQEDFAARSLNISDHTCDVISAHDASCGVRNPVVEAGSNGPSEGPRSNTVNESAKVVLQPEISKKMEPLERARFIHETVAQKIDNPSVTKLMNVSTIQKYKLVFPVTFVRSYMPRKNVNVTFKDEAEKRWICRWLGQSRVRNDLFIAGGWGPFVRAHSLRIGDVCIFELLDIEALEFKVYIFKR